MSLSSRVQVLFRKEPIASLSTLCLRSIAAHFSSDHLDRVPKALHDELSCMLSVDLSLDTVRKVRTEQYWAMRLAAHFEGVVPGASARTTYLEHQLSALLDKETTTAFDHDLETLLSVGHDEIRTVSAGNLVRHPDWRRVLSRLKDVTELILRYDNRKGDVERFTDPSPAALGLDVAPPSLGLLINSPKGPMHRSAPGTALAATNTGITAGDLRSLTGALEYTPHLRVLRLCGSMLTDERVAELVPALRKLRSVEVLDLSHNLIGKKGLYAVSKLCGSRSPLRELNLRDNALGPDSVEHLVAIVRATAVSAVRSLDLRMNRLGDDALSAVFNALAAEPPRLRELLVASTGMTFAAVPALAMTLRHSEHLKVIDLSSNRISEDGAQLIVGELYTRVETRQKPLKDIVNHFELRVGDNGLSNVVVREMSSYARVVSDVPVDDTADDTWF